MTEVFVGVGSNLEPERHLRNALAALAEAFGVLKLSPVYRSSPVGFEGDDFLNMVIGFDTDLSIEGVVAEFCRIEDAAGRVRGGEKFGPRTLDLDLLLYGNAVHRAGEISVPRDEITQYAFVLRPLTDIAGDRVHPAEGRSFAEMWSDFDQSSHPLRTVDLMWVSQ
ncbi:MAG: 2-amino-4-hydroxy-6-hydroxymethyldihydropteridine diphosphokinase [Gammaproteobacteria bacterium]